MNDRADVDATVGAARVLIGSEDASSARAEVRSMLEHADVFLPAGETVGTSRCVDGAVAVEQAESLAWIAAVAADNRKHIVRPKTAVVPVSSAVEHVSSATMALCELSVALDVCDQDGRVWLDGGLVTSLLSISAALHVPDAITRHAFCDLLDAVGADSIVDDFVDYAATGALVALPKQDTATSYCTTWASEDGIGDNTQRWLSRQRDRAVAGSIMPRGTFLAPRFGVEARRLEVKPLGTADARAEAWISTLDAAAAAWREHVRPYVAYLAPAKGPAGRAVKIECTVADGDDPTAVVAAHAAEINAAIKGSRIIEPYQQHLVDQAVKREVPGVLSELVGAARQALSDAHPEAVRHYRS